MGYFAFIRFDQIKIFSVFFYHLRFMLLKLSYCYVLKAKPDMLKKTISKTSAITDIFRRTSRLVPVNLRKQILYAMIHTTTTYGSLVWHTSFTKYTALLPVLQNKAIRSLFGYEYQTRTEDTHKHY